MGEGKSRAELLVEIEELRRRLQETEEVFEAIRTGEVDALVVSRPEGEQIYTLQGAEHAYRVLIESMSEGAVTLTPDATIVYCNSSLSKMLQVPLENLIGSPLYAHVAPADHPLLSARIRSFALACDKEEISLLTASGEQIPVLFSCGAIDLPGGMGVSVVITDITSRKQAEKTILRLNRLYAVLSALNHAIVHTHDRNFIFSEFCRVAVELGGFRLAWVGLLEEGSEFVKVAAAHGETAFLEGVRVPVRGIGPTGRAISVGSYYVCNDLHDESFSEEQRAHEHGLYSAASIAIRQADEVVGALALYAGEKQFFDAQQVELLKQMAADVSFGLDNIHRTERRREAEQALQRETLERLQTVEELRKNEHMLVQQNRNAAMGEMIGNIAHQWRQPLNNLALLVQQAPMLYELGEVDKEFLEGNAKKAMEYIQHMSRTIDDFRNFFKPDKQVVSFPVREEVAKTVSLMEEVFRELDISIEVEAHGEPVIEGYPNEFSQVLLNILINAKDVLKEREITQPRIVMTVGTEGDKVIVTIADNAGGIPDEIIGKIFDPYFTTKGPQEGTGLGLFMSKTIIEKNMGGRLSVRNIADGAEFRIEI